MKPCARSLARGSYLVDYDLTSPALRRQDTYVTEGIEVYCRRIITQSDYHDALTPDSGP